MPCPTLYAPPPKHDGSTLKHGSILSGKILPAWVRSQRKSTGLAVRFDITQLGAVLEAAHERLAGAVIERLPFPDLITRYDRADRLFYLDPPYTAVNGTMGPASSTGRISSVWPRIWPASADGSCSPSTTRPRFGRSSGVSRSRPPTRPIRSPMRQARAESGVRCSSIADIRPSAIRQYEGPRGNPGAFVVCGDRHSR